MSVPPRTKPLCIAHVSQSGCSRLADIHGNTPALEAVFRSAEFTVADAVAVRGCTTLGPDPAGTLALCRSFAIPAPSVNPVGRRG